MSLVAGIDACRLGPGSGWVAVSLSDGRFDDATAAESLEELLDTLHEASVIAIDMPIGLPTDGYRPCDVEARAFVGPRANSVFFTPPRAALEQPTHALATEVCAKLTGKGLSQQAYALRVKLLELEPRAASDHRIVEVHPEVSFRELAPEEATVPPKKTWNGHALRRRWLAGAGIDIPDALPDAARVPSDDVLDAAVAAWTAGRVAARTAAPLPSDPADGDAVIWR